MGTGRWSMGVFVGLMALWSVVTGPPVEALAATMLPYDGVVVDLDDDLDQETIARLEAAYRIDLEPNSVFAQDEKLMVGRLEQPVANLDAYLARLTEDPRIEYAEPNYVYSADFVPDDPRYAEQWHLKAIGVEEAWEYSRGDGVIVAVIDTGVAYEAFDRKGLEFHQVPDLAGTGFVPGYDFVNDDDHPVDDNGHGTHVAGTIAQSTNNGIGTAGVAFKAEIMPIKVLSGAGFGSVSDIADGVRWAADNGAQVINMSLGGPMPSIALQRAVTYARKKGVTVICAAGNSATSRRHFPAGFAACQAVAAVGPDNALAPYSNYGDWIALAAPGGDTSKRQADGVLQNTILRGNPSQDGYFWFQGTSMAAPHVAGVAALIVSQGLTNPDDVERVLKTTAVTGGEGTAGKIGAGVVDAAAAVQTSISSQVWRGGFRLAFALALVWVLARAARRRSERLGETGSAAFWTALLVAASGLFFIRLLPLGAWPAWLTQALSSSPVDWVGALSGAPEHNPLMHSALLPLLALGLFLGLRSWRPALVGLTLGTAAHLFAGIFLFGNGRVAWVPGDFLLDKAWLALNGLILLGLALVARGEEV